jgi:hypothetical protein
MELDGRPSKIRLTHHLPRLLVYNFHMISQVQHDSIHVVPTKLYCHLKILFNVLLLAVLANILSSSKDYMVVSSPCSFMQSINIWVNLLVDFVYLIKHKQYCIFGFYHAT